MRFQTPTGLVDINNQFVIASDVLRVQIEFDMGSIGYITYPKKEMDVIVKLIPLIASCHDSAIKKLTPIINQRYSEYLESFQRHKDSNISNNPQIAHHFEKYMKPVSKEEFVSDLISTEIYNFDDDENVVALKKELTNLKNTDYELFERVINIIDHYWCEFCDDVVVPILNKIGVRTRKELKQGC
jgi:hypothetical protein